MIQGDPDLGWRQRYNAGGTEEWARVEPGPGRPGAEAAPAYETRSEEPSSMPDAPGLELIAQEINEALRAPSSRPPSSTVRRR